MNMTETVNDSLSPLFAADQLTIWILALLALIAVAAVVGYIRMKTKGKPLPEVAANRAPKELSATPKHPDFTRPPAEKVEEVVPVGKSIPSEESAPREIAAVEPTPKPLSDALSGTKSHFWGRVKGLFGAGSQLDLTDLEEVLYTSDLGPQTVERLLEEITPASKQGLESVKAKLREEFEKIFDEAQIPEPTANPLAHLRMDTKPVVWMIVGVNGAGKTTSIGKIAAQLASQGKKVLVAAGDTFRAAAGAQLKVWTDRASSASQTGAGEGVVEIFHPEGVTDPSAVAFDSLAKAKGRDFDVLLIDTAGRLHTQAHLMDELKKVKRVMTKVIPDAPHETLIVLDANNGQNALHQAREFNQALGLTGVILTKMDGTAKGGVAVGLSNELKIPIRLIGVGEKVQDLRAFSSREFIDSILNDA